MNKTLEQRVEFLEATAIANLRDFFAVGYLSVFAKDSSVQYSLESIAKRAYDLADAMIKERKVKHE